MKIVKRIAFDQLSWWVAAALGLSAVFNAIPAVAEDTAATPMWQNVTSNIGGKEWGYAGTMCVAAVPGRDEVIVGVSAKGLWSTVDRGKTWVHLGDSNKNQINNRPYQIVFDPKNASTFWMSGSYGGGVFKTTDGGKSFQQLGTIGHVDGLGVDFNDPQRKTLLTGPHEQGRSLQMSTDGGQTWQNIGSRLPAGISFNSDPTILDSKTFLVNAAGWGGGGWGIYRSEDAGLTWIKVSDAGAAGTPTVLPNIAPQGRIYWPQIYGKPLLVSRDRGKSWDTMDDDSPVKRSIILLPSGHLAGLGDSYLYLSTDRGATWRFVGYPLPGKPGAAAYNAIEHAFYVATGSDNTERKGVYKLVLAGVP